MKHMLQVGTMFGLAALLLSGCGGPDLDTVKVTGKVTVAGTPTAGITVTFMPEAGGRPASGITDASGNFTMTTLESGDGAIPGKHRVAFGKDDSAAPPPEGTPAPADYSMPAPQVLPFNAKYTSVETSGITVDVVAGKTNELPAWDLEK